MLPFIPDPRLLQRVTWRLKQEFPGRILTAEITPEDPNLMNEYGFDAIWVHSGYFGEATRLPTRPEVISQSVLLRSVWHDLSCGMGLMQPVPHLCDFER